MKKSKHIILSTLVAGLLLSGGTYAHAKKPSEKMINKPNVIHQQLEEKKFQKELLKFKEELKKYSKNEEKSFEEAIEEQEDTNDEITEIKQELEEDKDIDTDEKENKHKKEKKNKNWKNHKSKKVEKAYTPKMKNGLFSLDLEEESEIENELKDLEDTQETVSDAVYENTQNPQKGLRRLVERLKDKTDKKSLTKLALIYKNLGEYDSSIELTKDLLEQDPTNKKALIISAQILRDTGKYDEAEELIDTLSTAYPELDLTAFKAILREDQGDLDGAIEALKEAIENSPTEKDLYKKIGSLYNELDLKNLKIFIDGTVPEMDVEPIIESGRTLVPIRAVAETMGAEVSYDKERRMAIVKKGDTTIELPLGFNQARVNGEVVELDVPSMVINDRLLIPLRFVAENLDAEVSYDGETKLITIIDADTLEEASSTEIENEQ